jgi:hypothetical protein
MVIGFSLPTNNGIKWTSKQVYNFVEMFLKPLPVRTKKQIEKIRISTNRTTDRPTDHMID